jgi:hypothetical protein
MSPRDTPENPPSGRDRVAKEAVLAEVERPGLAA